MSVLYLLGGFIPLGYGIYDLIKEIKIFSKGKQDKLGADIKIFGADIMFIMIGLYLICKYI
jgi:hypothetical protein